MNIDPEGKVIVVTGGAEGIGCAIAYQFLLNGAKIIIILDINEVLGRETVRTLNIKYGHNKAYFFKCDVKNDLDNTIEKIYNQFKSVDVLVNNAGVSKHCVDNIIDTNLKAVINWSFEFWERMRKDKAGNGGTILNISSIYGFIVHPYCPIYHASKFGIIGFSKSLGHKLNYNRSEVRVIVLCPGYTKTNFILTKSITFDDEGLQDSLKEKFANIKYQEAEKVGEAAIEIFKKGRSGSVWRIESGESVIEVLEELDRK